MKSKNGDLILLRAIPSLSCRLVPTRDKSYRLERAGCSNCKQLLCRISVEVKVSWLSVSRYMLEFQRLGFFPSMARFDKAFPGF